jgi:hypothetical protein
MRRVRCAVAVSLDDYIAGPNGEADWITMDPDPDFDFNAVLGSSTPLLLGAKHLSRWPQRNERRCPE